MEDLGVQSLQTFWWRIFPSLNRRENMTIGALSSESWIHIVDLKQLSELKMTKLVMYSITSKFNSTFRTIGKAKAEKVTAKLVDKISSFRFRVTN